MSGFVDIWVHGVELCSLMVWFVFIFSLPGGEGACGPALFALRAHLAFGKSLFRGELKLAYTPLHE